MEDKKLNITMKKLHNSNKVLCYKHNKDPIKIIYTRNKHNKELY